jgi:outer membrane lipoprotein SlyB
MKLFKVLLATAALAISTHASACFLCDYPITQVPEDSTLAYGTVVGVEPVNMAQVDYTQLNDHSMSHAGAALTGGSLSGAIVGSVVGVVADAIVHKSTKEIDGYVLTIALDTGETIKTLQTKNKAKSSGFDSIGDRLYIVTSPKTTFYHGSNVTKEESPAMVARRAPHQLKKPTDSEAKATPSVATPEKQEAAPQAEENKQVSAN